MSVPKHLWEVDHLYYCSEGNYYVGGLHWSDVHTEYESWADFMEDWGNLDDDLNFVWRWDWNRQDPNDVTEYGFDPEPDVLRIFWVLQRKAILRSTFVVVTESDEPAVRTWLEAKARHMRRLWEPLLDDVTEAQR
jgi:hypothetical protein